MSNYPGYNDGLLALGYNRKRLLDRNVGQDNFSRPEQEFRIDIHPSDPGPLVLGPNSPFYQPAEERDARNFISDSFRFRDSTFVEPRLSPHTKPVPRLSPRINPIPLMELGRPRLIEDRPRVIEARPRLIEDRPRLIEDRTRLIEDRPRLIERPRLTEDRPRLVKDQPRLIERPRLTEDRPRLVKDQPRLIEDRPRLIEERPKDVPDSKGRKFGSVSVFPPKVVKKRSVRGPKNSSTLRVMTLPFNMTRRHLNDLFSQYGHIKEIRHRPGSKSANIEFEPEDQPGLIKAIELDRCYIRIGYTSRDSGSIQVQFAIEPVGVQKPKSEFLILYDEVDATKSASAVSSMFKEGEKIMTAAKSLKSWFDEGHCTRKSSNSFFSLLDSVNRCTQGFNNLLKIEKRELQETLSNHRQKLDVMKEECQATSDIFRSASHQDTWNLFSKRQQEIIRQWSKDAHVLLERCTAISDNVLWSGNGQPPAKRVKIESDSIEDLQREVNRLRADKKMGTQDKDEQIQDLKGVLAKFRQNCPSEWERITDGQDILQGWHSYEEEDNSENGLGLEIVEEVSQDESPLSTCGSDVEIEEVSQNDSTTDSTEARELVGLSETEVATVSVMAAFLAVHPMGASIEEITTYLQGFECSYNSPYVESLLQKLTKVFQCRINVPGGNLPGKWCFLGFQTCFDKAKQTDN